MVDYTEEDLLRLDTQYAEENIPFHARPLRAAAEILKEGFAVGGGHFGNPQVADICAAYERLIPEAKTTWPGMGTGLVASVDRVRAVVVSVIYGNCTLSAPKGIGFESDEEWYAWCRKDEGIMARSLFAFADMHDLVYGIDELKTLAQTRSFDLWCKATEQLATTTSRLAASGDPGEAILQTIGLTAELALKGSLLHLGVPEDSLSKRSFGHNYQALANKLSEMQPHRDDCMLLSVVNRLPDYVESRYHYTGMTRLQIVELALGAQFVAATAVRRISKGDIAAQVETHGGARSRYFS
jgi:hypothetical protein